MADDKTSAFIFKEPATPLSARQLIDQTLSTTPVPRASSTANRDDKIALTPIQNPVNIQLTKYEYMTDLLKQIEIMKEQAQGFKLNSEEQKKSEINSPRQSIGSAANSSLGILTQDMFQELDSSDALSFIKPEIKKDLSQRLAKELGRPSLGLKNVTYDKSSKRESVEKWIQDADVRGLQRRKTITLETQCNGRPSNSVHPKNDSKNMLNLPSISDCGRRKSQNLLNSPDAFNGCDKISMPNEDFESGDVMKTKLLEEEKAKMSLSGILTDNSVCYGRKKSQNLLNSSDVFKGYDKISISSEDFASGDVLGSKLPEEENTWMSLSGILNDNISIGGQDKDKMSLSSFMRQGSCPLGSLGNNPPQDQRPTFGRHIKTPEKKCSIMPLIVDKKSELDEIPTKDTDYFHHADNEDNELSTSNISSVASVSQIAEILSNMSSSATPRALVNNILSKAKSRKMLTPISEGNQSTKKKYTQDFQKSFSEICDNFKRNSSVMNQEQENICPTWSSKDSIVPEGNCTQVSKSLKEQNNSSGNNSNRMITNTSVCGSEKSTQYSSSINSSLDLSDLRNLSDDEDLWIKMFKKSLDKSENTESSTIKSCKTIVIDSCDQALSTSMVNEVSLQVEDEDDTSEVYVCVATSVRMDFDVYNKTDDAQKCTINKRIYVNDMISTNAAFVLLENDELILDPQSSKTIPVAITPLVADPITIKIDVHREDSITKNVIVDTVIGKIIGEIPDIKVLSDPIISFDPIHEGCSTHKFIKLYNSGKCNVPLTLAIVKNSHRSTSFSFDGSKVVCITAPPGELVTQKLDCHGIAVDALKEIKASIEVSLTESDDTINLPELFSFPVSTVVAPCRLHIDQRELIVQVGIRNLVSVQNSSPINMNLSLIPPAGISVTPSTLKLEPGQKSSLFVGFDSKNIKGDLRDGSTIAIQILPNGKTYNLILKRRPESYAPGDSAPGITPQSSRAPSPMSPSSSVASGDGNMQLECTHTSLVWASHPVHTRTQKNCMLRNRSNHREKLLISISGSNNVFKILKDKKKLEDKLPISLQPKESASLTVVMLPTHAGAFTSSLYITRINSSTEKKVIPLYGYGGKAKLIPQGVSRDPDQRMWIYLDNTTLSTSFILKNVGDASAFVKISQGMVTTGISISPPECLIHPGTYVTVDISLTTTAERLEYLLSQPGDSAVSVTKLILTLGDESTRHRLNRLHRKLCTTEQEVDDLWNSRLIVLNGLFSDKDMEEVRVLKDPVSSLESLWQEGIQEWNIGVLVERTLLETMRLDYTLEYLDLENTIVEETICSPSLLPYKISPPILSISSKECIQELTLENMTLNAVPFECQPSAGLHVTPSRGVISSASSVKLYVSWIEPVIPTLEGKICVTFGNKETIEVPVILNSNINPSNVVSTNLGVYSDEYSIVFPTTTVGGKSLCRVRLFNPDKATALVKLEEISEPFTLGTPEFILKGLWYINLRVVFRPTSSGDQEGTLVLVINNDTKLIYKLHGKGILP